MKHLQIVVKGKVQGVWFRKYTALKAEELGVKGFVKNLPDGSVYIEAEGTEEALSNLVAWCHRGPKTANVEQVITELGALKNFETFAINY